ncbi:MAG: hypothetical protein ACTSYD_02390 [Candidatus Heimdallarchaeaceae archaeon]
MRRVRVKSYKRGKTKISYEELREKALEWWDSLEYYDVENKIVEAYMAAHNIKESDVDNW